MKRQVKDFPDYFVSEDGKVWSQKTLKYLTPWIKDGIKYIDLFFNGYKRHYKLDDLVAEVFPELASTLAEKNKKRESENKSKAKKGNQYASKSIIIDGIEYESVTKAAKQLDMSPSTIRTRLKSKNFPNYFYTLDKSRE